MGNIDKLRTQIIGSREENVEGRLFFPYRAINELMKPDVILGVLREWNIPTPQLHEAAESIARGALRTFAILVVIRSIRSILIFLKNDQFDYARLDQKLPLSRETLLALLPNDIADEFFEKQWEFAVPVFSKQILPRYLQTKTILPILEEKEVGKGGFGTVYEISLHPSHRNFGNTAVQKCVRKEFASFADQELDYEAELLNLSVLSHLKHPNIIELLSAYTYRGKHNLIFPLAKGGNLASFLQNEQPPEFRPNLTLFLALAKLSSAIEQVHNLTAEGLDLAMIGCHHDLKPKNILVDGSSFCLADFGLSRFKSASETSDTSHKTVQGDYIAPECEELEGDFKRLRVNRSSDIWSFGCIISEVLTYMVQGPAGVTNFRKQRGFKLGQFRYYLFHHGPGQPSTGVAQWLSDLGSATHGAERLLLSLAKKMLSMDHTARPNAKETRQYMRLITITEVSRLVENLFGSLLAVTNSSEAFIESKRFESWKWACGIPGAEEQALSNTTSNAFDNEFQSVLDTLFLMQGELETVINYDPTRTGWLYAPLRHLNTRLMDLVPSTLRRRMHTHFECSMTEAQDPRALEQHRLALDRGEIHRETGMLAAIKRMTLLTENLSELGEDSLRIEPKEFKQQEHFTTDCHVGRMEAADSDRTRQVLVEYLRYETSHLDEQIGKKRIESVVAIAKKLNSPEESAGFRSLRCSNYFHDEDNDRFGFVFDFPSPVSSVGAWTLGVTSLQRILDNTKHWRQMPALEDRYHLAEALAEALLKFHMAGWVHRRIASANIVFFQESDPITNLERPYIIGFSHSRLAEPLGFTAGPSDDKRYQHPTYLRDRAHFRQEFDYYSLGIVLLEIGLWKSLHQLDRNAGSTPEQFLEGLLQDKVPRLKATMGTKYFNVVDICLRGNFHVGGQPGGRPEDKTAMHVRFDGLVIQQLAECTV